MITEKTFTMHFWQVFLLVPVMWWSRIKSMEKDEAM